ncbi:perilipin-2-like isoform X2 [Saccostrea echinata]|uniref:perilipin-2-like isoform X2 n=1 Tax=Saccostrea echinata TaxID=191078 RepID=UPI002A7EF470|nr:perilipin-2-like isoform X2 [Saccostrea echinata]
MYRRSIMEPERDQEQFVSRLASLPVVSTAVTQTCNLYQRTKESNQLFRASLNLAESSIKTVAETSKPYLEKYQPQLDAVNKIACDQLEKLEERYPAITKPTDELVNDGKEACQAVLKPAIDRVNAVKQYGSEKYNQGKEQVDKVMQFGQSTVQSVKDMGMTVVSKSMETTYGQFVAEKMNDALTVSEDYINKYLPPEEEEEKENETEKEEVEMDEYPQDPVSRAQTLTTKVRRRMYKRAVKEFKGIQLRSKENLQKLNFTVDLIQYAKTNMDSAKEKLGETVEATQNKISSTWSEIKAENPDLPDTVEGRTIAVARHVSQQLQQSITRVTSLLPDSLQPKAVQERLHDAKAFTEELYQSFQKVERYEDVPAWVLTQTKERVAYLQETLSFLTEKLLTGPLNWLSMDLEIEDLNLEDPEYHPDCNGHVPNLSTDNNGRFVMN